MADARVELALGRCSSWVDAETVAFLAGLPVEHVDGELSGLVLAGRAYSRIRVTEAAGAVIVYRPPGALTCEDS